MSYTKVKSLVIANPGSYEDTEVELWKNDESGEYEVTITDCAWAGEGIRKKSDAKKVIRFLESCLGRLK